MNKLLVVEDIKDIKGGEYLVEFQKDTTVKVSGNVKLHSFSNYNLRIDIENKSNLSLEMINILNNNLNVDINIYNESILEYNMIIINNGNNKVKININMLGNDSLAKIRLRVINKNESSNLDIICNGFVKENTVNNELLEDLKGLLINNSTIKISPNMKVFTNEVIANHLVTIGSLEKDELFYLTSKGLSIKLAKYLLMEAFITNIISNEFKELIKMEVKNIE